MAIIVAIIVKSSRIYLFVSDIITVTATTEMVMPTTIFVVRGSPNISVPTRIAVIGSKTPNTDAFVAPILRVATASVAVDTMVLVCSGEVNEFYATEWEIWFTPEGEKEPKCLGKQEFLLMGTKSWW